jgi:UDP-N-acetylglucosamine 2-epimerase (hydrolysing)
VSNADAKRRLVQLGELTESVFMIGSPNVDIMLSVDLPAIAEVREYYEIPFDEYGVLVYHPVTTELDAAEKNSRAVVDAVVASDLDYVVIYPNNDSGSQTILRTLRELDGNPRFVLLPSMRFEYYLTMLKHAQIIVGNSSSGIHEAPVYGVPTVNVGTRQSNRFSHSSIVNVVEDRQSILEAILRRPAHCEATTHFGVGDSATRFMQHLVSEHLWQTPCQKQFRDSVAVPVGSSEQVTVST